MRLKNNTLPTLPGPSGHSMQYRSSARSTTSCPQCRVRRAACYMANLAIQSAQLNILPESTGSSLHFDVWDPGHLADQRRISRRRATTVLFPWERKLAVVTWRWFATLMRMRRRISRGIRATTVLLLRARQLIMASWRWCDTVAGCKGRCRADGHRR